METDLSKKQIEHGDTISAASSWSGYEYQGQVAVYWVIKCLNNMDLTLKDYNEFELELESLEDFMINKNGYPFSIHQVKAYPNTSAISRYKRAIFDLLGKSAKYPQISASYLHTLRNIACPESDKLKNLLETIQSTKSQEQFDEFHDLLFAQGKYENALEKFIVNVSHEDNDKCVIARMDIECEIKDQIRRFIMKNKTHCSFEFVDTEENVHYLYSNLIYEIDCSVAKGHVGESQEIKIPFSKFVEILTDKYIFKFSEKTAVSHLKSSLCIYFDEYCENHDLNPLEQCVDWNAKWDWICKQSDKDVLLLCKKLTPNVSVNTERMTAYSLRELVVKSGVHTTLLPIVLKTEEFTIEGEGLKEVFVLNKDGQYYLITTIAEARGKNSVNIQGRKVFQALKDDNLLSHILFDIHVLITNELSGTFQGKIVDAGSDYAATIPEYEKNENITDLKIMNFINIDEAKGFFEL